jgi:uncharacterized protein YdaU (DUF1376 family)
MAQFPCLPIWTDAWVADTDHLTCEEEGVYFRLVRVMWRTPGCRVPNDVDWLAKHMRMTPKEVVEKVWPIIEHFCNTDGNFVLQKRLKREFTKQFELRSAQSVRAKHREKNKKIQHPESTQNAPKTHPNSTTYPTLPYPDLTLSSFPTAATPAAPKKQPNHPARSLASAPDVGALTREPDNEPRTDKKPEEITLAEINAIRYDTK